MKMHRQLKNNIKSILRHVLDLIPSYMLRKSVSNSKQTKGALNTKQTTN